MGWFVPAPLRTFKAPVAHAHWAASTLSIGAKRSNMIPRSTEAWTDSNIAWNGLVLKPPPPPPPSSGTASYRKQSQKQILWGVPQASGNNWPSRQPVLWMALHHVSFCCCCCCCCYCCCWFFLVFFSFSPVFILILTTFSPPPPPPKHPPSTTFSFSVLSIQVNGIMRSKSGHHHHHHHQNKTLLWNSQFPTEVIINYSLETSFGFISTWKML